MAVQAFNPLIEILTPKRRTKSRKERRMVPERREGIQKRGKNSKRFPHFPKAAMTHFNKFSN